MCGNFFPRVEIFFPHMEIFFHGFSESTLYLDWTLPGCSELPPKVSEFANLCFCGSWQSLISSGKKPARTHKNKNLPTQTPLGEILTTLEVSNHGTKLILGTHGEKNSMCGKKISTCGKKFHMWEKISTHGNLKCIGSISRASQI